MFTGVVGFFGSLRFGKFDQKVWGAGKLYEARMGISGCFLSDGVLAVLHREGKGEEGLNQLSTVFHSAGRPMRVLLDPGEKT